MTKIRNFVISGIYVYGTVGALLAIMAILLLSWIITGPSFLISFAVPEASLLILVALPIVLLSAAILGGIAGSIMGVLRAATIHQTLIKGRGWVVLILAVLLAIIVSDPISGLALFLVWRGCRTVNISDPNRVNFLVILRSYAIVYILIIFFIGVIGGGLLAFFLGASATDTNYASDILNINLMMAELAQYLNSFSLQASIDALGGVLDASISGDTEEGVNLSALATITHLGNEILNYDLSLSSSLSNFVQDLRGELFLGTESGDRQIFFDGETLSRLLADDTGDISVVNWVVNGVMIGGAQGAAYGLLLALAFSILDSLIIRRVAQVEDPLAALSLDQFSGEDFDSDVLGADLNTDAPEPETTKISKSSKENSRAPRVAAKASSKS